MVLILVAIFVVGDDFAGRMSAMFTPATETPPAVEDLPPTLEPREDEAAEAPQAAPESPQAPPAASPTSVGRHVNDAVREACRVALQAIPR